MTEHTPRHDPKTPAAPTAAPGSRGRTINSKGEIVDRPYGSSRWATPKKYACAHPGCEIGAKILKAANSHPDLPEAPTGVHNCCNTHQSPQVQAQEAAGGAS